MYPTLLHLRLEIGMVKLGHFENVLETLFFHEIFDQLKANIVFELLVCQKFEFSKLSKLFKNWLLALNTIIQLVFQCQKCLLF